MDNVRKAFAACFQNFRKWTSNPRILIILLLLITFINIAEQGIKLFAQYVHIAVSACVFPFIMAHWYQLFIIMFGLIMLFCDAPFLDDQQPYVVIRTGKRCWLTGQILYIFLGSAVYFLVVWFLSILVLFPNVAFSAQWGKIIRTLAETDAGAQFHINLIFQQSIVRQFSPLQAVGLSFFLSWLAGSFLGLLMFVINMHTSRATGALIASGVVLFEIIAYEGGGFNLYLLKYFSPVSWASLNLLDFTGTSQNPPFGYAVIILTVMNLVLIILAFLSMRKKNIEVLPQI